MSQQNLKVIKNALYGNFILRTDSNKKEFKKMEILLSEKIKNQHFSTMNLFFFK